VTAPLITAPGAYPDISNEDYHRNANLLPGPSLSSSGAKKLLAQSPFHFWYDSPLNPGRPDEGDASHFAIGKAAHDVLLLADRFDKHYHVLPEGFAWNKTKAMPDAIAEATAAQEAGLCLLKHDDKATVDAVAAVLAKNPLVCGALKNGVTEETLAWQDPETGVWLRARPDFRSNTILTGGKVRLDVDLKFMAATHCSPVGFSRAIGNFGFHQSAAFYAEGLKACHGHAPTNRLHIVVEKDAPHSVSLYELPHEDVARGHDLNRRAIRLFADCLSADRWPAYSDEPSECGLPGWARHQIDQSIEREAA
jgi:hypothetical protein